MNHLLFTMYRTSGHPGSAYCDAFWFGKDGPIRVDLEPVWRAVGKVMPQDGFILDASLSSSAPTLTFSAGILDYANGAAAGHKGHADIKINVNNGRVVVVGAKYFP